MTGEYAPKRSYADKIRNRRWYDRFLETAKNLRAQGLTWAQVEYGLNCMYDMLNDARAFRYHHIAVSARESMQLAARDARKKKEIRIIK